MMFDEKMMIEHLVIELGNDKEATEERPTHEDEENGQIRTTGTRTENYISP